MESLSFAVAHDLRQPLLAALLTMDGLREVDDPGVVAMGHDVVRASLVEALERIRALLELAGLERRPVHREVVHLADVANAAVQRASALHPATAATFRVQGSASVIADPALLGMVVGNLVENALVHGCQGPSGCVAVHIAIADQGGRVDVVVTDDGPGVDPALVDQMFEVYARSARHGGNGLGLTIAQRAARCAGGDLVHTSVEPHGARFHFMLPR